jgi:hypothetical protein
VIQFAEGEPASRSEQDLSSVGEFNEVLLAMGLMTCDSRCRSFSARLPGLSGVVLWDGSSNTSSSVSWRPVG